MKILLVHNFYGSAAPSGENRVFEAEACLLRDRGHQVAHFVRHSDSIRALGAAGQVLGAVSTPWNPRAAWALAKVVDEQGPQVVHVHNTFPLISPAIFRAVGRRAARVLTLHNYRLFCAAAIPMRNGGVCTECLDRRSTWPAIRSGCYRGSRMATIPLAINISLHRSLGTWQHEIDAFIALSEFQRDLMISSGLPAEKVHVKPNFYPGTPAVPDWGTRRNCIVFAGRLSHEKGALTLLNAWRIWGAAAPELRIVGDGPLRGQMQAAAVGLNVSFLGQVPEAVAQLEISQARMLIIPSESFEGFPMVLREAFAFGTPVAVSDLGPLPTIVHQGRSGVVFAAGQPESIVATVRALWESPDVLQHISRFARQAFEDHYNEDANYRMLIKVYDGARAQSASATRAER